MIGVIIFYMHIVGVAYAFAKSYHDNKLSDGLMAVAFVAVIFSVGWTIAGFIVNFTVPDTGIGPIDRDSLSLIIVTVLEAILYLVYFRGRKKEEAAEG